MAVKIKLKPEVQAMLEYAPEFGEEIFDQEGISPGKTIARGFAAFKQYINRKGRPKLDKPTEAVTIRLPREFVDNMRRSNGKRWRSEIARQVLGNI